MHDQAQTLAAGQPSLAGHSSARDHYLSRFARFEKGLNGQRTSAFHAMRRGAISRFAELGLPTTRQEDWRFTDVSAIAKVPFELPPEESTGMPTSSDLRPLFFEGMRTQYLVFIDGRFSERLSSAHPLSGGTRSGSLAEFLVSEPESLKGHIGAYADYASSGFTALNMAFLRDGGVIYIPPGRILDTPIHLLFVSTGGRQEFVTHPRNIIIVGDNAEATIVESYIGLSDNVYFTNTVTEIAIGKNAVLEHERIQREGPNAFHVSTQQIQQGAHSTYVSNAVTFGGRIVRNNINSVLAGEGAECTFNGLYFGTARQHIDNHTVIDHAMPHCPSHELYKGILGGHSRGIFNGKIFVRKDAQKTDAKQTNRNLLLSDSASVDTKPQLEIFANDVKCTHGATIGQLDEESIFYLRSRGIEEKEARDLLTFAFAGEIIERIKIRPLRERLDAIIRDHLKVMEQ